MIKYACFVPFKSADWHSRLSNVLNKQQRRFLAFCELAHVLYVLQEIGDTYVGVQRLGLEKTDINLRRFGVKPTRLIEIEDVTSGIREFYKIIGGEYSHIIICGSDLPGLSKDLISTIKECKEDIVFSSAPDGGTPFYRIRRITTKDSTVFYRGWYIPQLYLDDGFTNSLRQIEILRREGVSYKIITTEDGLDGLCRDLDTIEDLNYFLQREYESLPLRYLRKLVNRRYLMYQNSF